ncbi:MAG: peptidoglycan DD-metalloendopeptidase family protein [Candidatus Falkowbacteria bacterium]|nr:peptidoglycan DD-metalloendopeptidase family protein [Candidatus Falkowbacteria bacterium]
MKISKTHLIKTGLLLAIFIGLICVAPLTFSQYESLDDEINALNLKILNQKKQLETLQERQQEYQVQIELKQKDKINLSNQLSILENRLAKAQLDIESVNIEIDKTGLEIKKIEIDSDNLDKLIEKQKTHIANLLRSMYRQDQVSTLEILLLNDSLSDFLDQAQYLADTNREIGESLKGLRSDKSRLEQNKAALDGKNTELAGLKDKLEEKKDNLSYEQENKTYILEETQSSEKEYQALLQQAKREQQQAEAEIASAEQLIRQKMSQKDKTRLNNGNNTIAWPVPSNTIVATFHDPDYPYRNIIGEHSGVDIRARQGTAITAAADGYVAKVKFNGDKSYAYIMLIHGNGLATVYGHVSAVYVMTDQYVTQGQAIGRTGGTPGGIGTGGFSTGPHLHFEVRLNGLPVNPQEYLP